MRKSRDFTVHHTFLSINYFLVTTNDRMLKYLYLVQKFLWYIVSIMLVIIV